MQDGLKEVLASIGVRDLGSVNTPKRWSYIYTVDWDTTIAPGGSAEARVDLDSGSVFVVEELRFLAWIPSASGAAIAFTPLYDSSGSPTLANNTFDGEAALRMDLYAGSVRFTSNPNGVRIPLLTGKAQRQAWEQAPMILPGGQPLVAKLFNDSAQSIQAQLVAKGTRWLV